MMAAAFDGIPIGIAAAVWKIETASPPLPPSLRISPDSVGTTEAISLTLHEMMAAKFDGILVGIAAAVWKSETASQ